MRGIEWGTGTVKCGFCGVGGHNITSCSEVNRVAKEVLKKMQEDPNYKLYGGEKRALWELKRREERRAKQKSTLRRKPSCSFCGSREHKRNKCNEIKKFKSRVSRANIKWRRAFVDHMNEMGFGIGSLVSLPVAMVDHWAAEGTTTAIIVGYNKEKLNMFCLLKQGGGDYHSEASVELLCDGKVVTCPTSRLHGDFDEAIVGSRYTWSHYFVKSLASSKNEPPEDFYTMDGDETFEWFFKKITTKQKPWMHIDKLVRRWLR